MPLIPDKTRVLVPLELPEAGEIPRRMIELLRGTDILLVGWYEVPEQTPPEQARAQVDDTGKEALAAAAERLRDAGAHVDVRHVFTPDLVATVQRLAAEEACDAALISGPIRRVDRILVVLREEVGATSVGRLLADLEDGGPGRVTLLQISVDQADEGRRWSERILAGLDEKGVDTDRVETRVETADDPGDRVLAICRDEDFDVVVIPERGGMEKGLFGSFAERVGREAGLPVLVIRGGEDTS